MLVNFLRTDKESKYRKKLFFRGGGGGKGGGEEGGGGVVAGGGMDIMYKCLKWHFYSSRNTTVPNCSKIHA